MTRLVNFQFSQFLHSINLKLCVLVCCLVLFPRYECYAEQLELPLIVRHLSVEEGLSQATVYDIFQDSYGFIWIATESGINRYDGHEFSSLKSAKGGAQLTRSIFAIGEDVFRNIWIGSSSGLNIYDPLAGEFTRISADDENSGLKSDAVNDILKHSNGTMWVATFGGLHLYVYEDERFRLIPIPESLQADANQVTALVEAPDGKLILGTQKSGVFSYDMQRKQFEQLYFSEDSKLSPRNEIRALHIDKGGKLWIGTNDGLFSYDYKNHQLSDSIIEKLQIERIQRQRIRSIAEDKEGKIWVAIYGDGILSLNPQTMAYKFFDYIPSVRHGLSGDSIDKLVFDDSGLLWIGTEGYGVNIWDPVSKAFDHIIHNSDDTNSLSNNVIWGIDSDLNGNLWVSTDRGINKVSRDRQSFTRYTSKAPQGYRLSNDLSYALVVDDIEDKVWIATAYGLNELDIASGKIKHWLSDENDSQSISDNFIYDVAIDVKRQLWIASASSLDRMDLNTGHIYRYRYSADHLNSISNFSTVTKLYIDHEDNVWVGTDNGLNRYNRERDYFDRFLYTEGVAVNTEINAISSISEIDKDLYWVGFTGDGLKILDFREDTSEDKTSPKVKHITISDGLRTNLVFGILPESAEKVWLSTMNGLMRYDTSERFHRFFGAKEGLLGSEFNDGAFFQDGSGVLYFGTTNGIALVDPALIPSNDEANELNFVEMVTYINQSTSVSSLLQKQRIALPYAAHAVKLKFTNLNYYAAQPTQYAYQLDSDGSQWIEIGNNNSVMLNNLPVGTHEFKVRHKNGGRDWSEAQNLLIHVIPPWWRTFPAYVFYSLGVLGLGFLWLRAQGRKIAKERAINMQLKQVDRLKDEFLANTSHELRTPLNGIIGLAESLLDGVAGELPGRARHNLAMLVSSGKRLANLVNDILDFSKLKDQSLNLTMKAVDLHSLADVVLTLSKPLTAGKDITLVNDVSSELPPVHGDEDRLQQILLNLVGNGIKFSNSGEVKISAVASGDSLCISVCDHGIGIDADKLDAIFESFGSLESGDSRTCGGAGLGLAVSKRLVELHGGTIVVKSKSGEGAIFSFCLPISDEAVEQTDRVNEMVARIHQLEEDADYGEIAHQPEIECGRFRILLVDDDPINRRVLHNHLLVHNYQMIEAASGEEALLAMEMNGPFDLVLLDIMMPRMSGYEVCEKLREKYPVNDLTIIFLTAKNQVADLVQSFAVGANDYLTKPVVKHELLSRVEMHLKMLDINRNLERMVNERTAELEKSNHNITALSQICAEISSVLDMNELLLTVYQHIKQLMTVDVFCIGLFDEQNQTIDFKLAIECGAYLPESSQSMDEEGRPAVWCIKNKKPMVTNNFVGDYAKYFGAGPVVPPKVGRDAGSLMYWPLTVGDKMIGVLTVQSYDTDAYNENQQDTIGTLAATTAIAIDNATAYREVEQKNHEIIAAQQQLVQAEKMVSLGSLTAGVAHEINNPTNFVHVSAQNLEVDLSRFERFIFDLAGEDADEEILDSFKEQFKPLYDHLATIKDGTERIKVIVQDLRAFTQLDVLDPKTVDITDCLQSTINLVQTKFLDVAEFVTDFQEHPQLLCHPAQLNQVFMNLIVNACDAIREKQVQQQNRQAGVVNIGCQVVGEYVEITVKDNGCGMTKETQSRLFEPFYTTKAVGEGTGLGLSISFGIVNKHKGELTVKSEMGHGSEFTLKLPLEGAFNEVKKQPSEHSTAEV